MTVKKSNAEAFRDLAGSITMAEVSDFLKDSDWVLVGRREDRLEFWLPPSSIAAGAKSSPLVLPIDKKTRDYDLLVREALVRIAGRFGDDARRLLRRIKSRRWDVLALRIPGTGDSVGLEGAASLLRAGTELLRLSALYTDNPYRMSWGSRRSASVAEYLRDGVRLGRTDTDDFNFPLLSRVWHSEAEAPAFGRQVMKNLAHSLERIQDSDSRTSGGRAESEFFDSAIAKCLCALQGIDSVEMSFHWFADPSLAVPESLRDSFDFDASQLRRPSEGHPQSPNVGPPRGAVGTRSSERAAADSAEFPAHRHSAHRFTGRTVAVGANH